MVSIRNFFTTLGTDADILAERDDRNEPHLLETIGTVLDPVPVSNRAFVLLLDAKFDFLFEKFPGAVGKLFGKAGFFRILPGFFRGKAFGFLAPGTGFKPALCGGLLALTLIFPQTVFPQEVSSDLGRDQAGEHVEEFAGNKSETHPQPQAGNKRGAGVRVHSEINGIGNELSIHSQRVLFKYGFILGLLIGIITGIYIFFPKFARRFLR